MKDAPSVANIPSFLCVWRGDSFSCAYRWESCKATACVCVSNGRGLGLGVGNTLVVIEHKPNVIRLLDWPIDREPEGGSGGAMVVGSSPHRAVFDPAVEKNVTLQRVGSATILVTLS